MSGFTLVLNILTSFLCSIRDRPWKIVVDLLISQVGDVNKTQKSMG